MKKFVLIVSCLLILLMAIGVATANDIGRLDSDNFVDNNQGGG